jgi:hypothetical protein
VSHSLYFLAASWLAAQGGSPAPLPIQTNPAVTIEAAPPGYTDGNGAAQQPRRGLFARFHDWWGGLFGRNRQPSSPVNGGGPVGAPNGNGVIIQQQPLPGVNTNEPPLAVPNKVSALGRAPIAQVAHEPARGGLDLPVSDRFRDRVGHEGDYSWITGQLYRIDAGNTPLWILRYATKEMQDQHGGTVLLASAVNMSNFREGDLVSVRGEVLNGGRHSEQIASPVYRASDVNLIERGD